MMSVVFFLSISELDHGHQQLIFDGHGRQRRKGRDPVIALKQLDAFHELLEGEFRRVAPWERLVGEVQASDLL